MNDTLLLFVNTAWVN